MKTRAVSIHKFERNTTNEDAVLSDSGRIAVSDGAGGGGVYADLWSAYLLKNLPQKPIESADELDGWIGRIWEAFYNSCESKAKKMGGMLLDKFYDEGSFATLAAAWKISSDRIFWMTYGDSVVFHYNCKTQVLEHSFTQLADFNKPPYLINCKDELDKSGYRSGTFQTDKHSVVFIASDTLAHYLLMNYEILHKGKYSEELMHAKGCHTKNSVFIERAEMLTGNKRFYKDILKPLIVKSGKIAKFNSLMKSLNDKGLLGYDDYSFAWMKG